MTNNTTTSMDSDSQTEHHNNFDTQELSDDDWTFLSNSTSSNSSSSIASNSAALLLDTPPKNNSETTAQANLSSLQTSIDDYDLIATEQHISNIARNNVDDDDNDIDTDDGGDSRVDSSLHKLNNEDGIQALVCRKLPETIRLRLKEVDDQLKKYIAASGSGSVSTKLLSLFKRTRTIVEANAYICMWCFIIVLPVGLEMCKNMAIGQQEGANITAVATTHNNELSVSNNKLLTHPSTARFQQQQSPTPPNQGAIATQTATTYTPDMISAQIIRQQQAVIDDLNADLKKCRQTRQASHESTLRFMHLLDKIYKKKAGNFEQGPTMPSNKNHHYTSGYTENNKQNQQPPLPANFHVRQVFEHIGQAVDSIVDEYSETVDMVQGSLGELATDVNVIAKDSFEYVKEVARGYLELVF